MTGRGELERKPLDEGGLQRLIDQLYEFLTSPDPADGCEGSELVIQLEPNDFADDPRILELLELLREAGLAVSYSNVNDATPEFGIGTLHDGHATRDVTDAIKAEIGPQLDEQTAATQKARNDGNTRSKSVPEQIEIREAYSDALRSVNVLMNELAHHCARRLQSGCTWWDDRVPEPIRRVLEPVAAGAAAAAASQNPAIGAVVAVSVVALVSRKR